MNVKNGRNKFKDDLLVEELRQRFTQYRWEDETRTKFIHFYFIFFLAFWGVVGFLSQPDNNRFIESLPHGEDIEWLFGNAFLMMGIIGTLWLTSIISFRTIQKLEGKVIGAIKSKSLQLKEIGSPHDRVIPLLKTQFYSTTPLSIVIFSLNFMAYLLSTYFYFESNSIISEWISIILNILSMLWLFIYTYEWKPKLKS